MFSVIAIPLLGVFRRCGRCATASRFWVGGTATWDTTAGTKWATTSGGIGGAAVPTASDAVFFDANSGSAAVTIKTETDAVCASFDSTGFTGSMVMGGSFPHYGELSCKGNCTIGASTDWSAGPQLVVGTPGGSCTLTTNGVSITTPASNASQSIIVNDQTNLTLGDDLTVGRVGVRVNQSAVFNANNKNLSIPFFYLSNANAGLTTTVLMGSGTWDFTGTGALWNEFGGTTALTPSTSTIKISNTSATAKTFDGKGRTFHNLWVTGTAVTIASSNTWADFRVDPNVTLKMTAGSAQTITSANLNGSAGNLVRLQSSSAGSAWNLVCASGTITADWVYLQDSHASGGATFTANDATDGGNNTGWTIIGPISPAPKMFLTFSIAAALLGAALAAGGFGGGPIAFDRRRRGRARARPVFHRIYRHQDRRAA